jgi:hypothetical protein
VAGSADPRFGRRDRRGLRDDQVLAREGPITSDLEYLSRGKRMAQHQVDILTRTTCDTLDADLEMLLNDPEFEAVSAYGYRHLLVADKLDAAIKVRRPASDGCPVVVTRSRRARPAARRGRGLR